MISFQPPPPGQDHLVRALLQAEIRHQQTKAARQAVGVAAVATSVIPWVVMIWPAVVSPGVRLLALVTWAGLAAATGVLAAFEWRWGRAVERCARLLGGDRSA